MGAKSDFWLAIHNVCVCLEEEGSRREERTASIAEAWTAMPNSARKAILQELQFLLAELPHVESELLLRRMASSADGDGELQAKTWWR